MTWFKVDDRLHGHVKTRRAGIAAMGLWCVVGSYCADNLTDGVVDVDVPELFAGKDGSRLAAQLVRAGLWHVHPEGGWIFHDWAEYQPTAASVRAEREASKARMAAARSARVRPNTTQTPPRTLDEPPANDTRSSDNPVPVPVPVPEEEDPQTPASGAPARSGPVERVFDHWREAMSSPRSTLDAKRRKAIQRGIAIVGEDECKRAIDGCKADSFSMGDNDRHTKFNDVTLIFRDAAHVEKFLAIADGAQPDEPLEEPWEPPANPVPAAELRAGLAKAAAEGARIRAEREAREQAELRGAQ